MNIHKYYKVGDLSKYIIPDLVWYLHKFLYFVMNQKNKVMPILGIIYF